MRLLELKPMVNMIMEANVLNIDDVEQILHDSLLDYERLPAFDKMFSKKIRQIVLNDPAIHIKRKQAMPSDPPWAHEAVERGEDIVHVNTEKLYSQDYNSILMSVYDAVSEQNVEVIKMFQHAKTWAELVDMMHHAQFGHMDPHEGLTKVDTQGEFEFYRIDTQEALEREGSVLQNCLGGDYTMPDMKMNNQTAIIMKQPGAKYSVVAIMTQHVTEPWGEVLREVKGKQNQPPVAKYVPAVIAFLQKQNLFPLPDMDEIEEYRTEDTDLEAAEAYHGSSYAHQDIDDMGYTVTPSHGWNRQKYVKK